MASSLVSTQSGSNISTSRKRPRESSSNGISNMASAAASSTATSTTTSSLTASSAATTSAASSTATNYTNGTKDSKLNTQKLQETVKIPHENRFLQTNSGASCSVEYMVSKAVSAGENRKLKEKFLLIINLLLFFSSINFFVLIIKSNISIYI